MRTSYTHSPVVSGVSTVVSGATVVVVVVVVVSGVSTVVSGATVVVVVVVVVVV
jgi:hypothetical protein